MLFTDALIVRLQYFEESCEIQPARANEGGAYNNTGNISTTAGGWSCDTTDKNNDGVAGERKRKG